MAWLAGRQHGCLHRRQLRAAGVGRGGIAGRRARVELTVLHRDVFLFRSAEPAAHTREMAAALHYRGDAVICGRSAAGIWGLTDLDAPEPEVLLVGRSGKPAAGVTLHRAARLDPRDVRQRLHIPVTAPARSWLDLCGDASLVEAESALAMLRHNSLAQDRELAAALARLPANHRGISLARELLGAPPGDLTLTRSHYERRLRELLTWAGLAQPLANHPVAGHERDLVWPEHRLIVEFDGWIFHRNRFRQDRRRDATAVAAGWSVIRLTADRLDHQPFEVVAELAGALIFRAA